MIILCVGIRCSWIWHYCEIDLWRAMSCPGMTLLKELFSQLIGHFRWDWLIHLSSLVMKLHICGLRQKLFCTGQRSFSSFVASWLSLCLNLDWDMRSHCRWSFCGSRILVLRPYFQEILCSRTSLLFLVLGLLSFLGGGPREHMTFGVIAWGQHSIRWDLFRFFHLVLQSID